jgi:Domain of unknown function (DUF4388)
MARSHSAEVATAQLSGRLGRAFPPLAVLQVCHVAEMTGRLRARNGPRLVTISFREGEVIAAGSTDRDGLDALVDFSQWSEGRFEFVCGAPPPPRPWVQGPFAGLMLEICRQLDEARGRAS